MLSNGVAALRSPMLLVIPEDSLAPQEGLWSALVLQGGARPLLPQQT